MGTFSSAEQKRNKPKYNPCDQLWDYADCESYRVVRVGGIGWILEIRKFADEWEKMPMFNFPHDMLEAYLITAETMFKAEEKALYWLSLKDQQ
ncbi:hypothetical protein KAR91_65895 [Candidatus Pacearchaeota archaeon]|nr:hypothetical protein [Candidatus Pacearchaeota archaeon]